MLQEVMLREVKKNGRWVANTKNTAGRSPAQKMWAGCAVHIPSRNPAEQKPTRAQKRLECCSCTFGDTKPRH